MKKNTDRPSWGPSMLCNINPVIRVVVTGQAAAGVLCTSGLSHPRSEDPGLLHPLLLVTNLREVLKNIPYQHFSIQPRRKKELQWPEENPTLNPMLKPQ